MVTFKLFKIILADGRQRQESICEKKLGDHNSGPVEVDGVLNGSSE